MPRSKTNHLNGKQIQVVVDNPVPQAPTKQKLLQSMLHCASGDQENYPEAQWKNTPNHTGMAGFLHHLRCAKHSN